jgi:hypothetical protein
MDDECEGLPSTVLLGICLCIASDPEPLHTLSARMRTLSALSSTCREVRAIVREFALPALERAFSLPPKIAAAPPSSQRASTAAVHAAARTTPPTVESLVRLNEYELTLAEEVLCTRPLAEHGYGRTRGARVDGLLMLGDRGGALWRLVNVKRELRSPGSRDDDPGCTPGVPAPTTRP